MASFIIKCKCVGYLGYYMQILSALLRLERWVVEFQMQMPESFHASKLYPKIESIPVSVAAKIESVTDIADLNDDAVIGEIMMCN